MQIDKALEEIERCVSRASIAPWPSPCRFPRRRSARLRYASFIGMPAANVSAIPARMGSPLEIQMTAQVSSRNGAWLIVCHPRRDIRLPNASDPAASSRHTHLRQVNEALHATEGRVTARCSRLWPSLAEPVTRRRLGRIQSRDPTKHQLLAGSVDRFRLEPGIEPFAGHRIVAGIVAPPRRILLRRRQLQIQASSRFPQMSSAHGPCPVPSGTP